MTEQDFFDIDTTLLNIKPNPATHYLQFFLSEHPLACQNGMVNFARHVASQKIGRWLTPNEVVVHSDGDRGNCAPDNLLVFLRSELAKYCLPSHKVERVLLVCSRPECRREYDEVPSHASRSRYCSLECTKIASRKFHVSPLEMQQMVWEMPHHSHCPGIWRQRQGHREILQETPDPETGPRVLGKAICRGY